VHRGAAVGLRVYLTTPQRDKLVDRLVVVQFEIRRTVHGQLHRGGMNALLDRLKQKGVKIKHQTNVDL